MFGKNIPFQKKDQKLKERLVEVYSSDVKNHIVCIPNIFDDLCIYNRDAKKFWVGFLVSNKNIIKNTEDKIYFDSFITRPYHIFLDKSESKKCFLKWKEIFKGRHLVIVEGEKSRLGVGNDLFETANKISRILCPSKNAYSNYEEIMQYLIKNFNGDELFLIALGPTVTVMSLDLHYQGLQAIDIGHLDIEYEWFLRKVTDKINIENKYVNEAKDGDIVEDVRDNDYESQIIKKFL